MDLRRSPWILGVVLACLAIVCTPAGADEPNFTEEQKIDFLQHAKVVASKPEKKGKSDALHLTLSDGKVTYDASFQPIDERKMQGPGPLGGTELRILWLYLSASSNCTSATRHEMAPLFPLQLRSV
jgi:hypothetical protein